MAKRLLRRFQSVIYLDIDGALQLRMAEQQLNRS
jgi:hypothetical protein